MTPRPTHLRSLFLTFAATAALFSGAACAQSSTTSSPPPVDPSEDTVRSADGRAAAALIVSAERIRPGESVKVQLVNRGQVRLNHGRPVIVERWTGSAWEETDESRNTAWTMELVQAEPGRPGLEQPWPFQPEAKPSPGWYRFTKDVYPAGPRGESTPLIVRARVEVVRP